MKTSFAPLFALVLTLGLRPAEPWQRPAPEAEPAVEPPVELQLASPTWALVDEWLGLASAPIYAVTVTAYSSSAGQCDSSPHLTATGTRTRRGIIALSRDLLRQFNPGAPFGWGDRVHVEGLGEFIVEDTMSGRYARRADIWLPDSVSAAAWGIRELKLAPIPDNPLGL
jgi:3D (Asp-Asp-Asp) domain-containing protein